jgi:ribosome biogenesis GTPase
LSQAEKSSRRPGGSTGTSLVVSAYGRRLLLQDDEGSRFPAFVGRRGLRVVCGDRVRWQSEHGDEAVVVEVLPRTSELARPDNRGRVEVLAANLDRIVVVCAPEPACDWYVTDRYLAAAESIGASAAVVFNKADLLTGSEPGELEDYRRAGYPVLYTSVVTGAGLAGLAALLAGHTSVLVGQSGVGKSSLINALVPGLELTIATVSDATGEGRHTTTATVLHPLPGGGALVDSPGVRDFAPALDDPRNVARGFREIARLAGDCRFADCLHLREPNCAVKTAVEDGRIDARRYESYRRLLRLTNTLGRPDWARQRL